MGLVGKTADKQGNSTALELEETVRTGKLLLKFLWQSSAVQGERLCWDADATVS